MSDSIVFSTQTGNTKLLAETVYKTLDNCAYFGYPNPEALAADRLYVGFWTDRGSCDESVADFLKTARNKEVFLFGTAGFGGSEEYFEKILDAARKNLDESCTVIGTFMCQGKMPESVRTRYEQMTKGPGPAQNVKFLLDNFEKALSHPDRDDLMELSRRVRELN